MHSTIYLAEDDVELRALLALALRKDGHTVVEAVDGGELLMELTSLFVYGVGRRDEALVVTDLRMPVMGGLDVIRQLHHRGQRPPFILITAFADDRVQAEAAGLGALGLLSKPFDSDGLRRLVEKVGVLRSMQPPYAKGASRLG